MWLVLNEDQHIAYCQPQNIKTHHFRTLGHRFIRDLCSELFFTLSEERTDDRLNKVKKVT